LLLFLFPLSSFIICFLIWRKHGRDPKLNKTIVPEFEIPDNLSPLEMGGIMKRGKIHNNSITATIIRLGFLGYLKIEEKKKTFFLATKDFKLVRTDKPLGDDLYDVETPLLIH